MAAAKPAERDDDAALFARLAELERAEEAAEAAAQHSSGGGGSAEPLMPPTPAQKQQQQQHMGPAAAAGSHPRLAQLGQLQQAGGSAHVVSDVYAGVARTDNSGSLGSVPAVQGVLPKQQSGGVDEQQAAGVQRQGETSSAAASGQDDGGVSAVGNKLRRVSWADDPGSGGGAGGASVEHDAQHFPQTSLIGQSSQILIVLEPRLVWHHLLSYRIQKPCPGGTHMGTVAKPARTPRHVCTLHAGRLAVAQNDSETASKGLRRGFFDRRPAKPAVAPLPRTPAQKPGSRPAAPRSSIKTGPAAAADASSNPAQQPDAPRDPPPSFEQQQTAFTGAFHVHLSVRELCRHMRLS